VAVGSIGTVGGISVVNLPDPSPTFEDVRDDCFIVRRDIPADGEPFG
jgi:hypothetical protein